MQRKRRHLMASDDAAATGDRAAVPIRAGAANVLQIPHHLPVVEEEGHPATLVDQIRRRTRPPSPRSLPEIIAGDVVLQSAVESAISKRRRGGERLHDVGLREDLRPIG